MIDAFMQHDVVPIKVTTDGYGKETDTNQTTEKGFFEYNERRTFNSDGEVIDSKGILYLKADSVFDVTYAGTWKFKDVKNDRTYRAHEPQIIDDPRTGETHHYEILLV